MLSGAARRSIVGEAGLVPGDSSIMATEGGVGATPANGKELQGKVGPRGRMNEHHSLSSGIEMIEERRVGSGVLRDYRTVAGRGLADR